MTHSSPAATATSADGEIRLLYERLLEAWNRRAARAMAALFAANGSMVGFDGSQANGRSEIEAHLAPIFADHPTAAYVAKVREVRFLGSHIALLRAVAGMVPPGARELNPALNTVHTLLAEQKTLGWETVLFQSTPAAFHGRPELTQQLTNELREVLSRGLTCG